MPLLLPTPVTNTDVYLRAVLDALIDLNDRFERVEKELQKLNNAATQKPSIQLDVAKLAEAINKNGKSVPRTK